MVVHSSTFCSRYCWTVANATLEKLLRSEKTRLIFLVSLKKKKLFLFLMTIIAIIIINLQSQLFIRNREVKSRPPEKFCSVLEFQLFLLSLL